MVGKCWTCVYTCARSKDKSKVELLLPQQFLSEMCGIFLDISQLLVIWHFTAVVVLSECFQNRNLFYLICKKKCLT